jgi:hypothetical protein
MSNSKENKVWKISLNVWVTADDMRKAIDGIHNTMRDVCNSDNPIQAYESKSVKLDYIES